jgi:hypothetical protein
MAAFGVRTDICDFASANASAEQCPTLAKPKGQGAAGRGGSGTAIGEQGLAGLGVEIDPAYVDLAVRRWQTFTGSKATRLSDGQFFDQSNPYQPSMEKL